MKYDGLTNEEVEKSIKEHGKNIIDVKKKKTLFDKLIESLKEPMFILLILASMVYFIVGELADGIIMLIFIFFMIGIETIQEWKTDKAVEKLNELIDLNVKVIREGMIKEISSKELVVGDLVLVEEGDIIPADGLIIECSGLGIDESSLTGESIVNYKSATSKKQNKCFSGTNVVSGNGIIKLEKIGRESLYGKIANDLNKIEKNETPLQIEVNKIVFVCSIICLVLFISVTLLNFITSIQIDLKTRIIDSILSGITVAMATIPEEIPVVLTVFLSLGTLRLAKKNTLVRNLKTVETLGAISTLCVDKTGTLTNNKLKVKETYYNSLDLLKISYLSCETNPTDPMDKAIYEYLDRLNYNKVSNKYLMHEYLFNSETKMVGKLWKIDSKLLLCVKGAYENILPLCKLEEQESKKIEEKVNEYSKKGYRVIVVAKSYSKEVLPKISDYNLEFVGIIALVDPPKKNVNNLIKKCYQAGINLVMITGDNELTAVGIANQIGLKYKKTLSGSEIENMSDDKLEEIVEDVNIFTRVYPNHKMRIVNALQNRGHVVAMTGDGINDATALKKADVGIAMGKRGTNVAKEASDMILVDDNFSTIVDAIENGRSIYDNIRKAVQYIIAIHIPIALSSILVPFLHLPILLLPVHVVILELIIDPTSSIVFERIKPDSNIMNRKPRKNKSLIKKEDLFKALIQGFIMFLSFFLTYYICIKNGIDKGISVSMSFSILIISNILIVYVLQSDDYAVENLKNSLSDKLLVSINIMILLCVIFIVYFPLCNKIVGTSPLNLSQILIVIGILFISFIPMELWKMIKNFNK